MKKTLFVLFIALTLVACGGPGKDSVHIQPQLTSLVGVIEADSIPGTHTLLVEQGGKLSVKSLAFNLSESRYLGNKVEAVGFLDIENNVLEITGISVLEILRDLTDEDEEEDEEEDDENDEDDNDDELSDGAVPAQPGAVTDGPPSINMDLTSFESLPYYFRGVYPSSWYYAGSSSAESGVLHHYGFASEPVTPENKIIGLDVIEKSLMDDQIAKSGVNKIILDGQEFYFSTTQSDYVVFTSTGGRYYRVFGPVGHKDLILNMSAGISSFDPSSE